MDRRLFSELRKQCKTAHQMRAFNELVQCFAVRSRNIMMRVSRRGGYGYPTETVKFLNKILQNSVIEACKQINLKYRDTKLGVNSDINKGKDSTDLIIVVESNKLTDSVLNSLKEAIYDKLEENGFDTGETTIWLNEIDDSGNAVYQ